MSIERAICPDIYHPAVARDGLLTRLRIPGGVLDVKQCVAIADLLAVTGLEYVQVTNRANLQLRGLDRDLEPELLAKLIGCGLAAASAEVDGIRNIMTSPTAGIDLTELIDVRPLVAAWDEYLIGHPELGVLSNKFSVGFDGGGSVSILDRPNDITLLAVSAGEFLVHLAMGARGDAPVSVGVRLAIDECVPMLGAIARSYRRGVEELGGDVRRKPRLRDVIQAWGLAEFWRVVGAESEFVIGDVCLAQTVTQVNPQADTCAHLGVWPQQDIGLSYVGVGLLLGRLNSAQIDGLGEISRQYGSGEIRLTPWQNAIVPNIRDRDLVAVQQALAGLGLGNPINGLLTACAGATGCQFAAGDTQGDAISLSEYWASPSNIDRPINIHFSGCDKSCAQHYQADITLWGCPQTSERSPGYRLCVSGGTDKFGREIRDYLTPEDVRLAIDRLIRAYQEQRTSPQESFRAFTDHQSLAQLQQILNVI